MRVRKVPQRTCVGCQQVRPKRELVRVFRAPDGTVGIDPKGKRPGRGAYICPQASCLASAIRGKRLERALETTLSREITDQLGARIGAIEPEQDDCPEGVDG
jgi:predicted RNA-binding protein YlxR (DUF448 family)